MDKSVLDLLLNELREPGRVKSSLTLRNGEDEFSFLGCLCEAYRKKHPDDSYWVEEEAFRVDKKDEEYREPLENYMLPYSVAEWADLHEGYYDKDHTVLIYYASREDTTLSDIANYIESEELFTRRSRSGGRCQVVGRGHLKTPIGGWTNKFQR